MLPKLSTSESTNNDPLKIVQNFEMKKKVTSISTKNGIQILKAFTQEIRQSTTLLKIFYIFEKKVILTCQHPAQSFNAAGKDLEGFPEKFP